MVALRYKVGLLGGTFDPIHNGHLRVALELKQSLALDEMRLVPCHLPVHRNAPEVTAKQRAEMIQLAIAGDTELQLDLRELMQERPSYTFTTLFDLRAELGPQVSIIWALGVDAFLQFDQWHRYREILNLAHLAIIGRPGYQLPRSGIVADLLAEYQAPLATIADQPAGHIVLPQLSMLDISATAIRASLARGDSPRYWVPDSLCDYLQRERLYK